MSAPFLSVVARRWSATKDCIMSFDRQCTTSGHGITGVDANVHQDLINVCCVAHDSPEICGNPGFNVVCLWKISLFDSHILRYQIPPLNETVSAYDTTLS